MTLQKLTEKIFYIRGHKVMLDSDLADLYQVETGALIRAVRRNKTRFPNDFMFQLIEKEAEILRCQFGISVRPVCVATSPRKSDFNPERRE